MSLRQLGFLSERGTSSSKQIVSLSEEKEHEEK